MKYYKRWLDLGGFANGLCWTAVLTTQGGQRWQLLPASQPCGLCQWLTPKEHKYNSIAHTFPSFLSFLFILVHGRYGWLWGSVRVSILAGWKLFPWPLLACPDMPENLWNPDLSWDQIFLITMALDGLLWRGIVALWACPITHSNCCFWRARLLGPLHRSTSIDLESLKIGSMVKALVEEENE